MPAVQDTIVAVSTGWQAAPLGIVRLSGRESFALAARLGLGPPGPTGAQPPLCTDGHLRLQSGQILPATAIWFRGPRSYTGQDVVELHTIGCLPLLRELSARLIELGARRALPGEFTARALLSGRLDASQVEGVLSLMRSHEGAEFRQAARLARGASSRLSAGICEGIVDLLARVEAGIDFVEEEDVSLVTPSELAYSLDDLVRRLGPVSTADADPRAGRPHVALVGLPNAGKSTLFNALLGHERALVSPVLGTTRDVLSCEVALGGLPVVLQDCAGLGPSSPLKKGTGSEPSEVHAAERATSRGACPLSQRAASHGELELATHLAAERAAQQADLVLWVHAVDVAWDERETAACRRVPLEQRVLVHSKIDLCPTDPPPCAPIEFANTVATCATDGVGLALLSQVVGACCGRLPGASPEPHEGHYRAVRAALLRARELTSVGDGQPIPAELVSLELREACELLRPDAAAALDEELLARIFTEFCVGK